MQWSIFTVQYEYFHFQDYQFKTFPYLFKKNVFDITSKMSKYFVVIFGGVSMLTSQLHFVPQEVIVCDSCQQTTPTHPLCSKPANYSQLIHPLAAGLTKANSSNRQQQLAATLVIYQPLLRWKVASSCIFHLYLKQHQVEMGILAVTEKPITRLCTIKMILNLLF